MERTNSLSPERTTRTNYATGENAARMKEALEAAHSQAHPNFKKIAANYGVSRKSLTQRYYGTISLNSSPGKKPYLSVQEEETLVKFLIETSGLGIGYDIKSFKILIQALLGKSGELLTDGWVHYFMKKHPEISMRRVEALDRLRSRTINEESLEFYFNLLQTAYDKVKLLSGGVDLAAERIYAMDESGFSLNMHSRYVIAEKGAKNAFTLTSNNREHVTIISYAAASGDSGRPYFITPRKVNNFLGDNFQGSKVNHSSSGYINDAIIDDWVDFFVQDIRALRGDRSLWCLLLVDGHASHTLNPKALIKLNEARILVLSLPSHSSSILQVHDLAIFGPLKTYYKSATSAYIRENGPQMTLSDLPKILQNAWFAANNPFNVKSGFRQAGIYPLDLEWISKNQNKIPILMIKSKESKFNVLSQKLSQKHNSHQLIKDLEPLNLSIEFPLTNKSGSEEITLKRRLSDILTKSKEMHQKDKQITYRKNILGENPSLPKILNEPERLKALSDKKNEIEDKKTEKESKKRKEAPSSQPNFGNDNEMEIEFGEINYFKPSFKRSKTNPVSFT